MGKNYNRFTALDVACRYQIFWGNHTVIFDAYSPGDVWIAATGKTKEKFFILNAERVIDLLNEALAEGATVAAIHPAWPQALIFKVPTVTELKQRKL